MSAAEPMDTQVGQVLDRVRASGLLSGERPLVVLLSGGRDSVCLLDVTVTICGVERVAALHVNYGLRAEAAGDQAHCQALCERLGVRLATIVAGSAPSGNLHAWARAIRYREGHALARARDGDLAAGHTATDQVETILYRLAASPGRRALLGMAPRSDRLVRPLLTVTREQTAAYCRERRLEWREDDSNLDAGYARARVRAELVPALRSLHPAAERNVLRTAELLRDEAAVIDALVDDALGPADRISGERLAALAPALRRLVLRRLAERISDGLAPAAATREPELLALALRERPGALDIEGGLRAVVERGVLRFEATPRRRGS